MAGLACQNDDGKAAVFIGTMLESGLAITVCAECLSGFCAAVLTEFTGAPVGELIAHQLEILEAAARDEGATTSAAEPVADEGADESSPAEIAERTDAEIEQWIDAHRAEIQMHIDNGLTPEQAMLAVEESEAKVADAGTDADSLTL